MKLYNNLREANAERNKHFDPEGKITASFRGNELGGEVGEAQNKIKKLERERLGIIGSRTTVESLAKELADVVICADLIAMHYDIDLDEFVRAVFNAKSDELDLPVKMISKNKSLIRKTRRPDIENNPEAWARATDGMGKMMDALIHIIQMNRQQAKDQYGDANKADSWACVVAAREALSAAGVIFEDDE